MSGGDPKPGFYKIRAAPGVFLFLPVKITRDDAGKAWVQVGNQAPSADEQRVRFVWLSCAKNVVSEDAYRHAVETGLWPGDAPVTPAIGHNHPPAGEDLTPKLDELEAEALAWLEGRTVVSQAEADKCERLANDFIGLKKKAEQQHEIEKAPHLKAGRIVDRRYKPLIEKAEALVRKLKNAAQPFLIAREQEKLQAAAEAIAKGEKVVRADLRATTSGHSGRKLHLQEVTFAVIDDLDQVVLFFKNHPDMLELVQRLADACAKGGAPIPGATYKTEQRAA